MRVNIIYSNIFYPLFEWVYNLKEFGTWVQKSLIRKYPNHSLTFAFLKIILRVDLTILQQVEKPFFRKIITFL